jgi:hypothetical protein
VSDPRDDAVEVLERVYLTHGGNREGDHTACPPGCEWGDARRVLQALGRRVDDRDDPAIRFKHG